MTILHILEDFSLNSGGLRTVVKELNQKLNNEGINSFILSSDKEEKDDIYIIDSKTKPWRYSKKWSKKIHRIYEEKKVDIIHIHGVWMYPQYIAAKTANRYNIPFLISAHGMYEPWLWTKGTIKKKGYFNFFAKPEFSKAKVIHAITNNEKENLHKLFGKKTIIEIPNLIDHKSIKPFKKENKDKYILFLGRLDKKKGIDQLIRVFAKINNTKWTLKIAGGFNAYKQELEFLIERLQIQDKVQFLGLVKGEFKRDLFANAHVFVAPSHSEVIGMVNLEAAILKTPVITTYQTGLKLEWNHNGGTLINPTIKELTIALEESMRCTTEEQDKKGKKLCSFVIKHYTWENRIKDWVELYKNVLKK